MPIDPSMVEPLAERTRDLYADAEERLLGIIARQLAADLDAPGWIEAKLAAVQAVRRAAGAVVDELGKAVSADVFEAVTEAYNVGHRAAVAELGALSDEDRRRTDHVIPQASAVDRLAEQAVTLLTDRHASILRTVDDAYRAVVSEVIATPLLGTGTRRQATQDAMREYARRGITSFTDRAGRRWALTSYAEMAVRTSVGRAATEAHARTLAEHGVGLVIVSDSPRECPLCRPWERRILTISGPDAEHEVEVEHAVEDGRMVRVRVAGSLDAARRAGLQHPNCRHSTSAYMPGLTPVSNARPDPDGYEAGQRQRAIERHIRRWKREEAAAVDPVAQRAARAKVRQWQGAMRDHRADNPDLRRLRAREQPGASNLPAPRTEATGPQLDAARVWSGDARSVREVSDHQLADAEGSGLLDGRARARVEAEADRRDLDDLLARVRPGGRLAEDLLAVSDRDLARVLPHLDDADTLRVIAEARRRDLAAGLPGVRRELVGLSDQELAARARTARPDDLADLAVEADRRDLLARFFPGGNLTAELSSLGDDALGWCMRYADADELARIAEEMDRRDAATLPPPAVSGDAVEELLADRDALADVMGPHAPDPDGWGALADDDAFAKELAEAVAADAARDVVEETARTVTRAEARAMYDEYTMRQYLAAEDDLRGVLLNKKAQSAGVHPEELFSGPARIAYARASDELKEWWADHGRLAQAEFVEMATGRTQRGAAAARKNESDQQNRR
ncbi:phage minor capsid protein [Streptomyces sp. NRRL F-5630]|uniref:phage minor capsid protein n=1 Tax=Streptomyces sp. NRRL F-5630 TaxID=1463864 RepID=UPI003EBE47A3